MKTRYLRQKKQLKNNCYVGLPEQTLKKLVNENKAKYGLFPHPFGVAINSEVVIGKDVIIFLELRYRGGVKNKYPIIKDNDIICANR